MSLLEKVRNGLHGFRLGFKDFSNLHLHTLSNDRYKGWRLSCPQWGRETVNGEVEKVATAERDRIIALLEAQQQDWDTQDIGGAVYPRRWVTDRFVSLIKGENNE